MRQLSEYIPQWSDTDARDEFIKDMVTTLSPSDCLIYWFDQYQQVMVNVFAESFQYTILEKVEKTSIFSFIGNFGGIFGT